MQNAWIIARRELGAIYVQPIAYIFSTVMLFITGIIFAFQIAAPTIQGGPPPAISNILLTFTFITVFTIPAITMRLLSEEQRSGTIEVLMTMPISDIEVVVGKFLAAFIFYASMIGLTLIYPLILLRFGNPDVGPMVAAYVGTLLWGASLIGIGTFASALTENQIVSLMLALGINLFLYLTSIPSQLLPPGSALSTIFTELSLQGHMSNFTSGLITATDVIYYLAITAITLFAAARTMESRRWR